MHYTTNKLKGLKRSMAFILVLAMIFTSLGISGWGTNQVYADTPESITCYLTVSVAGEIPEGDNGTSIAQVAVTVTDQNENGILDIDDALFALHETYYTGGAVEGYSTDTNAFGLSITKLWGDSGGAYGYYVNNNSAMSLKEIINAGDYISAFVYSDGVNWSDSYTKFGTFTKTAAVGEDINLELEKMGFDAAGNPVWSDLTSASVYNIANPSASLAISDDTGNARIAFSSTGTYFITASHPSMTIVPPVCKIIVREPDNYATVRIEGNGLGTDGNDNNINTVLNNTMVNLDALVDGFKAIDVVNAALTSSHLSEAEEAAGFYKSFGGVSAESGAYWRFVLNNESAPNGLDKQNIEAGDNIILMLTGSTPGPDYFMTVGLSYFKTVSSLSDVQWGYSYGEVTLALYSKMQNGSDASFNPTWSVTPVTNTSIYVNGKQAYTPNNALAITDEENGMATITLWGGDLAGTYYFDIIAEVADTTSAYCRAKMVYDGTNPPILTFSVAGVNNTTLSELILNFPGAAPTNGLSYVGGNGMSVGNSTESVSIYATANAINTSIDATYLDAESLEASAYTFGEDVALAVGENTFKLRVTNGNDIQIHTLTILRESEVSRDISDEVSSLIEGIKGVKGSGPYTDWVLAMNAANLSLDTFELETYLAAVLTTVNNFNDNSIGNPAALAKLAIALTSLGIDSRQIPDPDNGEAIDLISLLAASYNAGADDFPVYSAPYFLCLYDLGNYSVPVSAISTRLELIDALLDDELGWTNFGYDGVGMALLGLAPYYNASSAVNGIDFEKCQEVTAAVNRALDSMSEAQTIDGGFGTPNSNTISTVIIGLNAISKNPHTENAFIKSGNSLLMNLLSFRTVDDKLGFANSTNSDIMSCLQGFQALSTWQNLSGLGNNNLCNFDKEINVYTKWPEAKLLTGINVLPDRKTYEINDIVDPMTLTVQAIYNSDLSTATTVDITSDNITHSDFTAAGNYTVTVNYLGEEASYVVSVGIGSTVPEGSNISLTIRNGSSTIASEKKLQIENGRTSVIDALRMLAAEKNIDIIVNGGIYVSEIAGISEFSGGENSGWLYKVNRETATDIPAASRILYHGDILEWYFSGDYTKDSGSSAWTKDVEKTSEFLAKEDGKGSATLGVSKADMDKLVKDGSTLKAKSSIATVEMDAATLKGLGSQMGKDLEITAKKVDVSQREDISQEMKEKIGDRPVLDLTVMSGSQQISKFDGNVKVSIPYTLKDGENPSTVVIYLLKDNGEVEIIKNGEFNPVTGEVTFTTSHFSLYGIAHRALAFKDIDGHWAKEDITYLAARDYITGMSKDSFAPNGTLTRGQFVQLLANLATVDLDKYGSTESSSINDVSLGDWFAPAVAWAIEEGIVKGVTLPDGTISFYPERSISRQDIAVMLNRYRDKIDKKGFPELVSEKSFQDQAQISDYAKDAVKALQKSEIIQGKSESAFAPLDQAKRGEAAKMIYGMLKLK